jgi:hypothetical protein
VNPVSSLGHPQARQVFSGFQKLNEQPLAGWLELSGLGTDHLGLGPGGMAFSPGALP